MSANQINLDISANRSGNIRLKPTGVDNGVQTEKCTVDRPKLRVNKKYTTDEIKSTCAKLSSVCGVSVEMSRKIVQIVCKTLYSHDVYLSTEEQLAEESDNSSKEPASNASMYDNHTYVLPSTRTIADYKQLQASEMERDAGLNLLNKDEKIKATVHFDTTSRSSIDGEWPSIIIILSDGQEFRLRPLFFAYEDRDQITELFVETFTRLSIAVNVAQDRKTTPLELWQKVDALMTDAVVKNLGIETTISNALGSDHQPLHLLCKSHTVKALDRSNLKVLAEVEKSVQQQDIFEKINPALKSFFRGKTALVEAGIEALLTLVTHDKSGKTYSQADLFDHICELEGVSKRVFLYQQRRFAKLGKAALSVLQAKDILIKLLDQTEGTNQLVESCKIYMSSELFLTELECLSFFNHFVTFPFLNCVERSSQQDLCKILPKLYNDLLEHKTNTLLEFVVRIHRMEEPSLSCELSKEIVNLMCTSAAEAIKLQCGREYGFSDGEKLRASKLSSLTSDQLEGLPTNNLSTERDLSRFDREARVSKSRNRKFKAINIRNNMVLYKTNKKMIKVDKVTRKLALALSINEEKWNEKQMVKFKERIELKLKKASKAKDYTKKLLQECKSWGGPCTTMGELQYVLKGKPDQEKTIVKTELAYYAHTHKADKIARPDLFRQNSITHDEKLENLMILLADDNDNQSLSIASLPTNEDVAKALQLKPNSEEEEGATNEINQLKVVIWQNLESKYEWYIGYVKAVNEESYLVDHLHRVVSDADILWKYPKSEDLQLAEKVQILDCDVNGEWDISPDARKRTFTLKNKQDIINAFRKL